MNASLIITTYNSPKALELVLLSAAAQTRLPDEIIIADDGSTEETRQLIDKLKKNFPTEIRHIWHQDQGFQRSKILNKAIAAAKSDYLIQADGDCILHPAYISDHLAFAKEGYFLFGSRIRTLENTVDELLSSKCIRFGLFSSHTKRTVKALHNILLARLFTVDHNSIHKFRGCNISYWKKDIIAANGYNEEFKSWGREDSELVIRFLNGGIQGKRLKFCGILYHIHHPTSSKAQLAENSQIEQNSIDNKLTRCSNGLDQYLTT